MSDREKEKKTNQSFKFGFSKQNKLKEQEPKIQRSNLDPRYIESLSKFSF